MSMRAKRTVRRLGFVVFAGVAIVLIVNAVVIVAIGPAENWPVAVIRMICAAALEACWFRVGSVAHRSPGVSLPIFALSLQATLVSPLTALGLVGLGILLSVLVRTRRITVALYSAGLVGAGGLVAIALFSALASVRVGFWPTVLVSSAGYVVFVVLVETLRRGLIEGASAVRGRQLLSPSRLAVLVVGTPIAYAFLESWRRNGVPFVEEQQGLFNATLVLLLVTLIAVGVNLVVTNSVTQSRMVGLVNGSTALNASAAVNWDSNRTDRSRSKDQAAEIVSVLCGAVASAIGAESVEVRALPPGRDEIGAALTMADGAERFVVARRDFMDRTFTVDDKSVLLALAHTANLVIDGRRNVAGLTMRANTDPLTGLPNYGAFQFQLAELNEHRGHPEGLAVLFLDIDDFKLLNDEFGHKVGDGVLAGVGTRLQAAVRPHDVIARVGGDEFVIVLTELSSLREAKAVAERIMTTSDAPLTVDSFVLNPLLSIGLAYSEHRETDVHQLVQDADLSMLALKKSRPRGTRSQASRINISSHRATRVTDVLARAIDEDELELAFQPIVDLETGQIWAFEALLRFTDPNMGPLSPPVVVEKSKVLGRFDTLTEQVALKAIMAAVEFKRVVPSIDCMTINIEAGQVLPNRAGSFLAELATQYPAIRLCLELNERSMASVSPAMRHEVDRLRESGLMIALDDYGSPDSSVDAVVRIPLDILKIDRSLVNDLDDIRQREIVIALQKFGDNVDCAMVVEGVESAAMAASLTASGIRHAQGFYYGRPVSAEQTLARLREFGAAALVPSVL